MKINSLIGWTLASAVCLTTAFITGCGNNSSTMKGTTYVNDNARNTPMVFMLENVGVIKFLDDEKVDVLFPYALDTQNISSAIKVSSEMWISCEYGRVGDTVTILFQLNKDQAEPGVLRFEVKDQGKTLLGENGERFYKVDK